MASISVDIEAVRVLVAGLRRMQREFASLGTQVGWYDDAIGSRRVADSLGEFATDWSHARDDLCGHLEELAAAAEAAAASYTELEARLAAEAMRPGP